MRTCRLRTAGALGLVVAIVLGAFWRLALMKGFIISDDIFASDLMNENFPYRFSLGEALHTGQWPLWVREIYGGLPLLARSESGVCYPFNLVLFALFSPYVALNLTILLLLVTAGAGMYFYVREIEGTRLAAITGAVAFSFSGFLMSHLKHLSMANAACWLPVALMLLERAVKTEARRPLIWFALVFGLQNLSGNAQITYYCGALYLFYFGLRLLHQRRHTPESKVFGGTGALVASFAAAIMLGTSLAAVQLLPTYEMVSLSHRSGGVTFDYASSYPYDLRSFWTFFYPYAGGDIGNLSYTGNGVFWEDYGYVGLVTVMLALAAPILWSRGKSWHVKFFSGAALASYLLVLGPATPAFKLVFKLVPGMSYFRFPTRLLLITDASIVVLATMSLTRLFPTPGATTSTTPTIGDRLSTRLGRLGRRGSLLVQGAVLIAVVVDLLYFQLRQNPIVDAGAWRQPPATVQTLRQDPTMFRMYCVGGNHAHKRAFQQARGWEGDLQPFIDQREFIQPSTNVLYGIASPNGYANLTPTYLVDIWGDQNRAGVVTRTASLRDGVFQPTAAFWKLMRMYNVKYLTSFWPFDAASNLRTLGLYGGAHLYENEDFLPRAYLAGEALVASDDASAVRLMLSDDFHPERSVVLNEMPREYRPQYEASGTVKFLRYAANAVDLEAGTSRDSLLVFSDSYYPGWVATVDGRETPIYRANVTQRAVVVPAGQHRIAFNFRPVSVRRGCWISSASLLAIVGWFLTSSRMRGRRPPAPVGVA